MILGFLGQNLEGKFERLLFYSGISVFREFFLYFRLIYCCRQGFEIPVTLEIPAIGIFSKSNLSKRLKIDVSFYTILQILSLIIFKQIQ